MKQKEILNKRELKQLRTDVHQILKEKSHLWDKHGDLVEELQRALNTILIHERILELLLVGDLSPERIKQAKQLAMKLK